MFGETDGLRILEGLGDENILDFWRIIHGERKITDTMINMEKLIIV